jgi:hypothetical protein
MPVHLFYTDKISEDKNALFFFNSLSYVDLAKTENTFSFILQNLLTNEILATVHFELMGNVAYSPPKAPFGGLATTIHDEAALGFFWNRVEEVLKKAGTKRIELRICPNYFNDFTSHFFAKNGYDCLFTDSNFHFLVSEEKVWPRFGYNARWCFQKCIKKGFVFESITLPEIIEKYEKLFSFRAAKRIPTNISKESLIKAFEGFSEKYCGFVVRDANEIIGISVCVEINENILYHFLSATDPNYQIFSPSLMLYEGIYRHAQSRGYKIVDLGTASIRGEKQQGLFDFKKRLGAVLSKKPTFFKEI